ncbi:BCL2/adenovirus E1B 19 kDa protein-interacting protein 2-like [Cynoglossus semilaevis]|uniref:BCL2/adenovirus E1B 19 kDa protein-interacting protein 2-like n=1 Tax=Cynoglossus semilaevis TaxID=244447 RepID=UPI000495775E|nr:BCL2/adenovirus E1B 19 kDa protein-interacting protein 2-like [Cynoglossus semilaevis]XP_016896612.1 BCL2/adenovirus E1B 19 kDa protein-interacting protein 2-like [Cynoglossus semilaevis]XP_016896614.1 BCL2/adenovirus E1B 19 kDa protein-interacting protein 2-like [Cynoglossus semilaevis]XP_016896615.1 BCL2/adenovirus E1B 19 kDa protein-interacting protein 2-like [Cynoglossus semilaevis]
MSGVTPADANADSSAGRADEEDAGASVGTEGNGGGAPGDRDTCVGRVRDGTEGEGQVGGACAGDDDDDVVGGATAGVEQDGAVKHVDLRPAPPTSLNLSASASQPRQRQKKVLVAPALSLSLDQSDSAVSNDFLSPEDDDDTLDIDLDAIETPSDSDSLPFPIYDLEDDLRGLGVSSDPRRRCRGSFRHEVSLESEDMLDSQGTRWRCFSTGDPPQESRVNMSVLEPFLPVLSHGGYYGDGMNDIIVFSSCFLPQNSLEKYAYVMDNLFRYVVGTLDLMVTENYVMVYFCAGGQKEKLPEFSWLRECYTTIHRRLRKNLKGFYVVHPTWYIKALITIIKPFISSKFSRKLQFADSLQELSEFIPTDQLQIPDCVRQYDETLSR